ncbi:unnamed protein product [Protopolystoma xenopodis]|uniref:Uncharacterized protein n=1 Tax=Protopolystoma xenopodis TaxID=117903 RepID=A0A448WIA8_9PLAT|nr:unnamed protein product [Protopolystoma xenopodis]
MISYQSLFEAVPLTIPCQLSLLAASPDTSFQANITRAIPRIRSLQITAFIKGSWNCASESWPPLTLKFQAWNKLLYLASLITMFKSKIHDHIPAKSCQRQKFNWHIRLI